MIRNLWTWLHAQMVQNVPDSITACEFDCRPATCQRGEWERCLYRRWVQAVGPVPRSTRRGSAAGSRGSEGRP
jgi:hypothetical protein